MNFINSVVTFIFWYTWPGECSKERYPILGLVYLKVATHTQQIKIK